MIRSLWDFRADIRAVLDKPCCLYGSRAGGEAQTFSDILKGLYDKMHQRPPCCAAVSEKTSPLSSLRNSTG